jgi:hypothetical protein
MGFLSSSRQVVRFGNRGANNLHALLQLAAVKVLFEFGDVGHVIISWWHSEVWTLQSLVRTITLSSPNIEIGERPSCIRLIFNNPHILLNKLSYELFM